MGLVAVAQAAEDLERVLAGRLIDVDGLETSGQGRILLDVLAELIEGRRADALNLAARKRRLEHVGSVDGALGTAGADQGVQLVDEQDDVACAADLIHHRLDALFELAAVLRAGDHHGQVQHHDPPVIEQLGNLMPNDLLGQPLDDGGFADAGFAEQDGIVFHAAAQDRDDAFDLVDASDDRIELALARQLGEVTAEGVECRCLALALACQVGSTGYGGGILGLGAGSEQVEHLLADVLQAQAEIHEDLGSDPVLLTQQAKQQVLGTDVVVVEVPRLLDGVLDDAFGPGGVGQLAHGDHFGSAFDKLFDLQAHLAQVDAEVLEHVRPDPGTLLDQSQEDVLGSDILVVEPLRLLIGQGHYLSGTVSKPFEHASSFRGLPPAMRGCDGRIRPDRASVRAAGPDTAPGHGF
jgi:hypothetical protein